MHFCKKCENMYYIKLNSTENELIHYCRHCGFEDTELSTKKLSVSKIQVKGDSNLLVTILMNLLSLTQQFQESILFHAQIRNALQYC